MPAPDPELLLSRLAAGRDDRLLHVERVPARVGTAVGWPDWVDADLRDTWTRRGIELPWAHQAEVADLAHAGRPRRGRHRHGVRQVAGLPACRRSPRCVEGTAGAERPRRDRALPLADEGARARPVALGRGARRSTGCGVSAYDGDTPTRSATWIRAHAGYVLTNPDMLHRSLLPGHARWASVPARPATTSSSTSATSTAACSARTCANVLRRLRRVVRAVRLLADVRARVGDRPATPRGSASRLIGLPVEAVTDDASPRGATSFALWEPPLTDHGGENDAPDPAHGDGRDRRPADRPRRRGRAHARVRAVAPRRRGGRDDRRATRSPRSTPSSADRVAAYRAGYLPEERRALEDALRPDELLGVAATNALELGVDITGLDAVLLCGWPGTRASLWQQAGRAGRSGGDALARARRARRPARHLPRAPPRGDLRRRVEATVFDPTNPYVLGPHLCAAAAELPLTEDDLPMFGAGARGRRRRPRRRAGCCGAARRLVLDPARSGPATSRTSAASAAGRCASSRTRPGACSARSTRARRTRPSTPARSTCTRARRYVVDQLDLDDAVAVAHREDVDWTTSARDTTDIRSRRRDRARRRGARPSSCTGTSR